MTRRASAARKAARRKARTIHRGNTPPYPRLGREVMGMALFTIILGVAFVVGAALAGCYAHAPGPGPSCSADPSSPGCLPPVTDARKRP